MNITLESCSVLLVDDDDVDRYLLKRLFKAAGMSGAVFESENGKRAVDFLNGYIENPEEFPEKDLPDIIFLDINMPLVNGFEFLDQFSEMREKYRMFEAIEVVIISSSRLESDREKGMSVPYVKGMMIKMPKSGDDLKKMVTRCLSN